MPPVPKKVEERLVAGIKRFQPIIASAKARDLNESDTVFIVTDMLSEIFGYDKYGEITSETAIRGTWCDLAIKLDGAIQVLLEVKAIGLDLKEAHTKQAVDYSANKGTELTNGEIWRVYKVTFTQPIGQELVLEINFSQLMPKKYSDIELLFHLTREGWLKSALGEYHIQKQALSRFFLSAMILSNPILEVIRRELKRLSPNVRIDIEQIKAALTQEVLKRDVIEGEKFEQAKKKLSKVGSKLLRTKTVKETTEIVTVVEGDKEETSEEV